MFCSFIVFFNFWCLFLYVVVFCVVLFVCHCSVRSVLVPFAIVKGDLLENREKSRMVFPATERVLFGFFWWFLYLKTFFFGGLAHGFSTFGG